MASSLNLYDVTVAPFLVSLKNLAHILRMTEDHAKQNNIDLNEFVEARIFPDMKPFTFQIQSASDTSKGVVARVTGSEPMKLEDNEKTFEDLQKRIQVTIDYLTKAKREDFEGREGITTEFFGMKFTNIQFCTKVAVPNFYFHVATAYDLVRSKGVPVGKMDYLKGDHEDVTAM